MSTKKVKTGVRPRIRYSEAFKLRIVSEIENEGLTLNEVRKKYGIKGGSTIQTWIKRLGKNHLLSRTIRIETVDEMNELKQLQSRIKELESALVATQLERLQSESYLRLACEQMGVDIETFKKKEVSKPPNSSRSSKK